MTMSSGFMLRAELILTRKSVSLSGNQLTPEMNHYLVSVMSFLVWKYLSFLPMKELPQIYVENAADFQKGICHVFYLFTYFIKTDQNVFGLASIIKLLPHYFPEMFIMQCNSNVNQIINKK